jgi:hypothetical protein
MSRQTALRTQDRREPPATLRGRQLLLQARRFKTRTKKEAERRHVETRGADRELPFFKQIGFAWISDFVVLPDGAVEESRLIRCTILSLRSGG